MKNHNRTSLKNIVTFCLLFSIFVSSSMIALAKSEVTPVGAEIVVGANDNSVTLDGEKVISGRTFFSSGVIATSENSATVKLGKLGYLTLMPNTVVSLNFGENKIAGTISSGDVTVFNNAGVEVNMEKTADAAANSKAQTNNSSKSSVVPLVLVFAGIVGVAAIYVLTKGDDDNVVSPVR